MPTDESVKTIIVIISALVLSYGKVKYSLSCSVSLTHTDWSCADLTFPQSDWAWGHACMRNTLHWPTLTCQCPHFHFPVTQWDFGWREETGTFFTRPVCFHQDTNWCCTEAKLQGQRKTVRFLSAWVWHTACKQEISALILYTDQLSISKRHVKEAFIVKIYTCFGLFIQKKLRLQSASMGNSNNKN